MDSDIIRPKKQEIDTSELDAARDELISAVEAGTIHEGRAEDGLGSVQSFENSDLQGDQSGATALSSTTDATFLADGPLSMESSTQNFYRAPLVDISSLPTERSRNQNEDEENKSSNVHIAKSQSSRIRNAKLEKESMLKIKKKKSPIRIVATIIAVIIAIAAVLGGAFLVWYNTQLGAVCPECTDTDFVSVTINQGDSSEAIANRLEEKGIIKSALAFRLYVKLEGMSGDLRAGGYEIKKSSDIPAIAKQLKEGAKAAVKKVMFKPGETITHAKNVLLQVGYGEEEINAAFSKQYDLPLFEGRPENASIEGYIFPETYEVYASASVEEILTETVFPHMQKFVDEEGLVEKYKAQGLSLYEGINLASIVQRESGTLSDDMPAVTRVFLNRLNNNQVLGSDAIVGYRADQLNPNRDKTDISYIYTMECPWNSRKCPGLPPTPISSPSKTALRAVAAPADHNYFYFLTGDDGKMYYAVNESDHNANIRNYCKVLCNYL